MNTLGYIKNVIRDEFRAIVEEAKDSRVLTITFLLTIIGLVIYLQPFPNRHIYFATYYPNSDWSQLASASAEALHKTGLNITVIHTDGAVDNVAQLNDPGNQANAAFTYGLALNPNELNNIYSLGSVAFEPVWILYNKKFGEIDSLTALSKLRVGLAPTKSGSYRIAQKIFEVVGVDVENNSHFLPDSVLNNGAKLKKGEIDAVVFVSSVVDPTTKDLLDSPSIAIYDFKNASAYAKKFNSFVPLTLPADSIDIPKQVPKHDISMLATTTSLVVKKNVHPDVQLALLMGAKDANRSSQNLFFSERNQFPAYVDPSIPLSPVAEHFYDYGPPHAMRYLPYWLAGLVDRAWLLILTVLAIFYPLAKLNIHFRKFRFNLKEIPHYKQLIEIERRFYQKTPSESEKEEMLAQLDAINSHAVHSGIPINEEAAYFALLNAITLLKRKIHDA